MHAIFRSYSDIEWMNFKVTTLSNLASSLDEIIYENKADLSHPRTFQKGRCVTGNVERPLPQHEGPGLTHKTL